MTKVCDFDGGSPEALTVAAVLGDGCSERPQGFQNQSVSASGSSSTTVWDVRLAKELEKHRHQISVDVKDHCSRLAAMIGGKMQMQSFHQAATAPFCQVASAPTPFCEAASAPTLYQTSSAPTVCQTEPSRCSGAAVQFRSSDSIGEEQPTSPASQIQMESVSSMVSGNQSRFLSHRQGLNTAIQRITSRRPGGSRSPRKNDPEKSRETTTATIATHDDIDRAVLLSETGSVEHPSELHQLLSCLCPCFFQHPADMDDEETYEDQRVSKGVRKLIFRKRLQNTVTSTAFDIAVGWLILLNVVVMIVQYQHYGYEARIVLGMIPDDGSWANADTWFLYLEHVFNALFLAELIARCYVFRCRMFKDTSNIIDFLCVVLASLQLYVLDPLEMEAGGKLFRMFRLLRFVRVMRIVRVMSLFSELRVLVKTCISSFKALIWSMVLLVIIMVMGGLLLCELLKGYILDSSINVEKRKWVFKYYGSSFRAMYSLFEVTLSGCWPNYFRPLIHDVSGYYVIFAVSYIAIVVFAVIRIITAIFLKETLSVASKDAEMMVGEQIKSKQGYIRKLHAVFSSIDVSGDGKLDIEEFGRITAHPKIKTWLQVLELEVHDVHALFKLLDDGDGVVSYDEFLQGIIRLKGQARSIDVVGIMRTGDKILETVRMIQMFMERVTFEMQQKNATGEKSERYSFKVSSNLSDDGDANFCPLDDPSKIVEI